MDFPGLPKWPQMLVTGVPVTPEQAKEIIRRTDSFFTNWYDGNDEKYVRWVRDTLGMPRCERDGGMLKLIEYFSLRDAWQERWGCICTEYVHNSWISSPFIYGAHGWCHPDGKIGFIDNVGKWPSGEAVFLDWEIIAKKFPFLDLGITLMSGEQCEDDTLPIVSMRVQNGAVTVIDPRATNVHAQHQSAFDVVGTRNPLGVEGAIPDQWILEWKERFSKTESHLEKSEEI